MQSGSTYLGPQGQGLYISPNQILNKNLSPMSMRGRAFDFHSPTRGRIIQGQAETILGRSPEHRLKAAPMVINQPYIHPALGHQESIELQTTIALKGQLDAAKKEAEMLKLRVESLERKGTNSTEQPEWEGRLDSVVKENERLHKIIKEKMGLKSKYKDYEQKLLRATEELEKMNSFMEKRESEYEKKEEDWRREYGRLQEELHKKSQIIVEMDAKILLANREIEKLYSSGGQIDAFKQVEILKRSVESLTRMNIDLERQVKNLSAERSALEAKGGDTLKYMDICARLEEDVRQIRAENENLKRSRPSEHWQAERVALINSIRDGENKIRQLAEKTSLISIQREQETREWREKYLECEKRLDEIVFYKTEIQRLQGIINTIQNQHDVLLSEKNNIQDMLSERNEGAFGIESTQNNSSWQELTFKLREQDNKIFELLEKNEAINDFLDASEKKIKALLIENSKVNEAFALKSKEWETFQESKIVETARLREMQENFSRLHYELERLNKILEQRENEITVLHSRNSELEGARLSLEENSLINRTRVADCENKLQLIVNFTEQLNEIITSQNDQLNILKERKEELVEADLQKIAIEELENQILALKHNLEDANRHNLRMVQTVEDLNNLIATNNKEIDVWRRKCIEVEEERSREIFDLKNEHAVLIGELKKYKDAIIELDQRILHLSEENNYMREVSNKVPQLEESVRQMELHANKYIEDTSSNQLANQEIILLKQELARSQLRVEGVNDLENKLGLMIDENERLLRFNEERVSDIEVLKREVQNYDQTVSEITKERNMWQNRYGSLIGNVEHLKASFEEYRQFQKNSLDRVSQSNDNKATANSEFSQLNAHITILQKQVENLHQEKSALIKTNIERRKEIETLNYEIDDKSSDLLQLSTERDICKRRSMNAEERLIKHEAEISSLKTQVTQYKSLNENSKLEISKLYDLLKNRKDDYERVAEQLIRIEKELNQERKTRLEGFEELSNNKEVLVITTAEKNSLENEKVHLKNLLDKAYLESEEKERGINRLLQELQELNFKYNEAVTLINSLESRISSPPRGEL